MKKRCSKCKKIRNRQQFSRNASSHDGYDHYCKICNKKRLTRYFRTGKGKAAMKRASLKRKK